MGCQIWNIDLPVDLELTKSDGGVTAVAGGAPFDYTITVRNVGERGVDLGEPVTVTDQLPAGLVWVAPAPTGCTITGDTQLICQVDPSALVAGGQAVIVASARALDDIVGDLVVNQAWVDTDDDPLIDDGVCQRNDCPPAPCPVQADNNVDCEPTPITRTPVEPDADLAIVKTSDVRATRPSQSVRWQLAITNNGPAAAVNVVVADVVPASLTVTNVISSAFNCTHAGNSVSCTVDSLAAGASGTVTIVSVVNATTPAGTITNTGRVTSDTPDPNPSNNTDDEPVEVTTEVVVPPTPTTPTTTTSPPLQQPIPRTGSDLPNVLTRAGVVLVCLGGIALLASRRRKAGASNT